MRAPIAYAVGLAFVLFSGGRSIIGPMIGAWSVRRSLVVALILGVVAFTCEMLAPRMICFYDGCAPTGRPSLGVFEATAIFLVIPVFETIVAQGWIQTRLSELFSNSVGIAVTAILFIGMHFELSLTLAVMSVALSVLRSKSQSLLAVATAHAMANLGIFAAMLLR